MKLRVKMQDFWPVFLCKRIEKKPQSWLQHPILLILCHLKLIGLIGGGELNAELERLFGSSHPDVGAMIRVSQAEERRYQEALRFKISAQIPRHPFTDYWNIFLLKHQNPVNVWVHVLAMIVLYGLIAVAICTRNWLWLLAIPVSQLAGLTAHALTERTHIDFEDAIFSPRALACLNRMLVLLIAGKYWQELEKTRNELKIFLKQHDSDPSIQ